MNQKVYFAGSIRGGQDDIQLYHDMITSLDKGTQPFVVCDG